MSTYRKPNDANARRLVENDIKLERDFAAVLTSPQVRAVLEKFDGKIINKRLDTALDAAAGEVVPGAHLFERRGDVIHGSSPYYFAEAEKGRGWIYGAYYSGRAGGSPSVWLRDMKSDELCNGARLDAAKLRAEFDRVAADLIEQANHNQRDLDNIEEWARKWADLCTMAHQWIYGLKGDYSDVCAHSVRAAFGMDLDGQFFWGAYRDERRRA